MTKMRAAAARERFYKRIISNLEFLSSSDSDSPAMAIGSVWLAPLQILVAMTIDRIGVAWGGTVAGNAIVGLYRDNSDTPVGGVVVVQSASIAKAGTTRKQEFAIADTKLTPGLYWIALESDEATSKFVRFQNSWERGGSLFGCYYIRGGGVYGALTDPCPAVNVTAAYGLGGYVRVKSIP